MKEEDSMRNMTRIGRRNTRPLLWLSLLLILLIIAIPKEMWAKNAITLNISKETIQRVLDNLIQSHGNNHPFRIERGVTQAASFWRESDGSETEFENFYKKHFISDPVLFSQTLMRIETNFEILWGYFLRISRDLERPFFVEKTNDGQPITILPLDHLFNRYHPRAHLEEELFKAKVAFAVIMNFPQYTLEEKLEKGRSWNRELPQEKLDKTIKDKYPNADTFKKDIPVFLAKFGFSPGKAAFIAERIEVEPSRQVGHGMAPLMRSDKAYLRAQFPSAGMNYSGFFLALHEMGHTIEQVCSIYPIGQILGFQL
jgi:hypothetical protein